MFDLTVLDYIYIGIVLASTIWATIRGGVYETVATLSWVIAAVVARFVSPMLDGLFQSWFKLSESTIGTLVAAYFIVFFVILVGFGFFNQKLRDRVQESMMKVTDHTLGVIFGIVRGIVLMGVVYWGALWYYSDKNILPDFVTAARTRPVMQLTAVKLHQWFIPGENKLLEKDMTSAAAAEEIYNNLINPKVVPAGQNAAATAENKTETESVKPEPQKPVSPAAAATADKKEPVKETAKNKPADSATAKADTQKIGDTSKATENAPETGYKSSERTALENQLLQIENSADLPK
ncbi:MAG: CvpA family protein [Rickettsiales bacterium]|jgi:membrane protein required for colicin V production|nr:CvpA family protein [Rickettsiales bacterium]